MSVYRTLFACHCVPSPFSHAQLKDGRGQKVTSCYCPSGESQISHIFFLFIKKIFTILVCESFRYKKNPVLFKKKIPHIKILHGVFSNSKILGVCLENLFLIFRLIKEKTTPVAIQLINIKFCLHRNW